MLTLGRFRELTKELPDNYCFLLAGSHGLFMDLTVRPAEKEGDVNVIAFLTHGDAEVAEQLRLRIRTADEEYGDDEAEFLRDVLKDGYTLEDFKLINQYDWALRVAEDYGLI